MYVVCVGEVRRAATWSCDGRSEAMAGGSVSSCIASLYTARASWSIS